MQRPRVSPKVWKEVMSTYKTILAICQRQTFRATEIFDKLFPHHQILDQSCLLQITPSAGSCLYLWNFYKTDRGWVDNRPFSPVSFILFLLFLCAPVVLKKGNPEKKRPVLCVVLWWYRPPKRRTLANCLNVQTGLSLLFESACLLDSLEASE